MFDLEKSIAAWRRTLEHNPSMTPDDLDELEQHVRDQIAGLTAEGMGAKAAFDRAVAEMGDPTNADVEYRKVFWRKARREHALGRELARRRILLANYVTTARRALLRHPAYSFLNIAGLTLGLVSCLLIFQYVAFEFSFDRFNEHAGDIYRVTQTSARGGEDPSTNALTGFALGPAVEEAIPEVAEAVRIHPQYGTAVLGVVDRPDRVFEEEHILYADASFLDVFSYPLVEGDPGAALNEPGTILLSQSTARKYFGDRDPIGQMMTLIGWIEGSFRVNGVFEDVPSNSHLRFDVLVPMIDLLQNSQYSDPTTGWNWQNFFTYVRLHPNADRSAVNAKLTDVLMQHQGENYRQNGITAHMQTQPLAEIRLDDSVISPNIATGNRRTVYFFTLIGLITLSIALVNYVNLATARALDRAREVGIRKSIGAQRRQLVTQFVFESGLTNLAALLLAIALTALLRPGVNALLGTELPASLWASGGFWGVVLLVWATGTLLAGLYPAFILSSFKPSHVLKGKSGSSGSRARLRQGLVVLQFAASVSLVAGTAIVYAQLSYMRQLDLGLDLEQVLTVPAPRALPEGMAREQAVATFLAEMRRVPGVLGTASSATVPGGGFQWYTSGIRQADADPTTGVDGVVTRIDTSFVTLYGLELIAGAGFAHVSEPSPEGGPMPVIITETARKSVGFETPQAALDRILTLGGSDARVVGVFEDVNWSSAHQARENIAFGLTRAGAVLSVKMSTANLTQTIRAIEEVYTKLFPGNPFNYAFADQAFDRQYAEDRRFAALFTIFAGLAIAIACLGLFGLASYTAQQRRKEIGVRKVLGASAATIVGLLTRDFVALVGIAFVIAIPIAYLAMQRWLDDFAYRIDVGPGPFVLTGLLVLTFTLLTVGYQSVRAALSDPATTLRYE